jgi:hypothetical protein
MALLKYLPIAQGAAGTVVVAAAVADQKHKVIGLVLSLNNTGSFKLTGAANLTGDIRVLKDASVALPAGAVPWVETDAGTALSLVTIAGAAQGVIIYVTEP